MTKPKGWILESSRHSLAAKGIVTGTKQKTSAGATPIAASTNITLHPEGYTNGLISLSGVESRVVVSGGMGPEKEFPFFGGGCGFAHINGKGVEFKEYFEEQNVLLRRQYGFDVFRVSKGYPSGYSVGVTNDFLSYIGDKAEHKIDTEKIPVPTAFRKDLMACAQQDMGVKEGILKDVHEQVKHRFPNSYVDTRLD